MSPARAAAAGMAARSLMVLAMALLAVLPWGEKSGAMLAVALALAGLLFSWALQEENAPPLLVSFVAGLAIDTLSGGPLGYWALILVGVHGAGRLAAGDGPVRAPVRAVVAAALGALAAGLIGWLLAMLYVGSIVPPWAMATGTLKGSLWASGLAIGCEITRQLSVQRALVRGQADEEV